MDSGLYVATSGLIAQSRRLEMLANNLANADTPGFKADRAFFELVRGALATSPDGTPVPGTNDQVVVAGTHFEMRAGSLRTTSRPFDLAIDGDGFFMVETPAGMRYTRRGAFQVTSEGTLVTSEGYRVLDPDGSEIQIGAAAGSSAISIDEAGRIFEGGLEVGQVGVRDFPDAPSRLRKEGDGLFAPVDPQDTGETSTARVTQYSLETSNVDVIRSMVEMIETQRAFDSYQRVITAIMNDLNQKAANQLGLLA